MALREHEAVASRCEFGFFGSNFMAWKKIPAISSAADMQEVGWPEPAAVVAIMERMLSRRAFSLMASIVEADGPADGRCAHGVGSFSGVESVTTESYIVRGEVREPLSLGEGA